MNIYKLLKPIDKLSELCDWKSEKYGCIYSGTMPYDTKIYYVMTLLDNGSEHGYVDKYCWNGLEIKIISEDDFDDYFEKIESTIE